VESDGFNAPAHDGCRRYCDFLIQAAYREPYPVLLAILFGVEASYLAAWSRLSPSARRRGRRLDGKGKGLRAKLVSFHVPTSDAAKS
jgi:hypothetical protein